MKNIFFFLLVFKALAQESSFVVCDSLTKDALPYTNVVFSTNSGLHTNEQGVFTYSFQKSEFITVSYVGYKKKKVFNRELKVLADTIFLKSETEYLKEVVLSVKRKQYSSEKKLGTKRTSAKYSSSVQYGSENAIYIENLKKTIGKLTNLIFFIEKKKADLSGYKTKHTYYRVNFYRKDKYNNAPGHTIVTEPILIKNTNASQKINIELTDYNIPFYKDGIYVGIETVQPDFIKGNNKSSITTPSLVWSYSDIPLTYFRYRMSKWEKQDRGSFSKSPFRKTLNYSNPLIKLRVKYQK